MSLIINLEIWFAQSLRVSRIWIKEIPIRKNKLWKNLEAPDSYGKSSTVPCGPGVKYEPTGKKDEANYNAGFL
jgi:hypothetical protein